MGERSFETRQVHFGSDGELVLSDIIEERDRKTGRVHNAALFFEDTRSGGVYGIDLYTVSDDAPLDPYENYTPGSVPVDSVGPSIVMSILGLGTPEIKGLARRVDLDLDDLDEAA